LENNNNLLSNEKQQLLNSHLMEINEHKEKQAKTELNKQLVEIELYSVIRSMLKCLYCENILNKPVVLPCKHTICQNHTVDKMTLHCALCKQEHVVPKNGFEPNAYIAKILDSDSYLNETERKTKEMIEKTNKNVDHLLEKLNKSKVFCNDLITEVETFPINKEKNSHLEGSINKLELVNRSLESSIIEIQNNLKIN
jgi:hypothetical protein